MQIENPFTKKFLLLSAVLSVVIYFFLFVRYRSALAAVIISFITFGILLYSRKESVYEFLFILLGGSTLFISLEVSFELGIWLNFIVTFAFVFATWFIYHRMNHEEKFAIVLFSWFVLVWIILAFNVSYRDDWIMENYLTVPFLVIIFLTIRYFKFSNLSYSLMFIYLFSHIVGSHYTYSEVPFGFWIASTMDFGRNHYDRLVHFGFGFLLTYPIRETYLKISSSKGFWALYIPIEFILAFSCVYELIEWGIAVIFGGDLGIAYLGTQGDVWDAQKDMFLAGLGSFVSTIIIWVTLLKVKGLEYHNEIKDSLRVRKIKAGEQALGKKKK